MLISSKGRYALRLMIYIAALGDAEGKIALRDKSVMSRTTYIRLLPRVCPLYSLSVLPLSIMSCLPHPWYNHTWNR